MEEQVLSILQMQELEELGIDTNHGSMYWHNYNIDDDPQYELCSSADIGDITTFTLQDILEMLPKVIPGEEDGYTWKLSYEGICYIGELCPSNLLYAVKIEKSLLDACFKMLKWCKQNNHI